MGKFVNTFGEMTKEDIQEAGGKAANLGELTQNGFNVPPGFCVTSGHYPITPRRTICSPKLMPLLQNLITKISGRWMKKLRKWDEAKKVINLMC